MKSDIITVQDYYDGDWHRVSKDVFINNVLLHPHFMEQCLIAIGDDYFRFHGNDGKVHKCHAADRVVLTKDE